MDDRSIIHKWHGQSFVSKPSRNHVILLAGRQNSRRRAPAVAVDQHAFETATADFARGKPALETIVAGRIVVVFSLCFPVLMCVFGGIAGCNKCIGTVKCSPQTCSPTCLQIKPLN